ncbi:alpha/beta fold hydrolase [Antrihabitans stalagmiti]|nr:alpha/beta hydrolase [Antrihabitans stalagmiti]
MEPTLTEWIAAGNRMQVGEHTLFVRQDGPSDGRPVTLLHGFPTSSHDWSLALPALVEAGCRVTTLDFLGFGASDKPHPHDYLLTEQATLVEGVWAALNISETDLVAHDYGVSVAQELLARRSDRITSMAWLNGGLYPDLHRPIRIQKLIHGPIGGLLSRAASERTFSASLRKVFGRPVADDVLHEMWVSTSSNRGKRVQHALLQYIDERKVNAKRWQQALESYAGSTLFVWGTADPVSGGHVLPRLRERLPDAEFVVLDAAPPTGHYPQVENPDAVGAALSAFLRRGELPKQAD